MLRIVKIIISRVILQPCYLVLLCVEALVSIIYIPKYLFILLFNKTVVSFDWADGTYGSFYRPIIKKLKGLSLRVVLFFNIEKISRISPEIFQYGLPRIYANLLKKKIILCASSSKMKKIKKTVRVQMFHSFGSFGVFWSREYIKDFEVLFLVTKYQEKQLREDFKDIAKVKKIYKIGYPKIDGLMAHNYRKRKQRYGGLTLFYGPTYHREISSVFEYLKPLVDLCIEKKYKLIVKLHPFLYNKHNYEESGSVNWQKEIEQYCKRYKKIINIKDDNMTNYFDEADIFITDVSGLGFEFVLATGKPIIFLGNKLKAPLEDLRDGNLDKYRECAEIYYRGRIGPIVINPMELDTQIRRLAGNNEYKQKIKAFREDFIYNPGAGAAAAVTAIKEIVAKMERGIN